jgi:hypothetical protein
MALIENDRAPVCYELFLRDKRRFLRELCDCVDTLKQKIRAMKQEVFDKGESVSVSMSISRTESKIKCLMVYIEHVKTEVDEAEKLEHEAICRKLNINAESHEQRSSSAKQTSYPVLPENAPLSRNLQEPVSRLSVYPSLKNTGDSTRTGEPLRLPEPYSPPREIKKTRAIAPTADLREARFDSVHVREKGVELYGAGSDKLRGVTMRASAPLQDDGIVVSSAMSANLGQQELGHGWNADGPDTPGNNSARASAPALEQDVNGTRAYNQEEPPPEYRPETSFDPDTKRVYPVLP